MKQILIVVTSEGMYQTKNLPTGLWLSELTHFYDKAKEQGYQITIASPLGGNTPIDPESSKPLVLDNLTKKYLSDTTFLDLLKQTQPLTAVAKQNFDCVYLTGGHGTMYDFTTDTTLHEKIGRAHV